MSKRDDNKELEQLYKSIDEAADKKKAVFLTEKNDQIKSCTKDIYEWFCNNGTLRISGDKDTASECAVFLKNYKHLTEKDINTIFDRLVAKKHIIKTTFRVRYRHVVEYKFNRNV